MAATADADDVTIDAGSEVRVTETSDPDGAVVLHIAGELDLSSVDSVRVIADRAIDRGTRHVVFDLSGLEFMDSSGIALLLTVAERVDSVTIREPSAIVRRVIEVSGLATTLPMTP